MASPGPSSSLDGLVHKWECVICCYSASCFFLNSITNTDSPGRFEVFKVVFLVHLDSGGQVVRLLKMVNQFGGWGGRSGWCNHVTNNIFKTLEFTHTVTPTGQEMQDELRSKEFIR